MSVAMILPSAERWLFEFLQVQEEVLDITENFYSEIPRDAVAKIPFVLFSRVGGAPAVDYPLVLDEALMQVSTYGGNKALTVLLAEICRSCLAERAGEGGVCSHVALGALRDLPDPTFNPVQARYIFDATLYLRASPPLVGGSS